MPKENRKNKTRMDGLFTVSEVADILHVHPNTVRQWSDRGMLKTYRFGRRRDRRFKREDVQKFIDRHMD